MTELFYSFPCGCQIKQLSDTIKSYDGLPPLEIDYYNLPLDCKATWNLISSGRTRGIFQLESNLGRSYAKKLEPDNIHHLAALTALLRPGCMNSILDGKSMTNHFIDRKQKKEEITYFEDKMEQYLNDTYGILVYQEQIVTLSKGLAGLEPEAAMKLLKAIAKKKMDKLMEMKQPFIDGCYKTSDVSEDVSTKIFDNIESSGRYSFNKSHSYSYGGISYWTAFVKAHFPLHFFCSYLKNVKDNTELKDLMSETSLFNITVKPPSISNLLNKFNIKDGYIQYGLGEVKEVGKSAVKLIEEIVELEKKLGKPAEEFTWYEFLTLVSHKTCKTTINNLILAGFLDGTGVSRKKQLHEYNTFLELSNGEMKWVSENCTQFEELYDLLVALLPTKSCRSTRKPKVESLLSSLKNPGKSLDDDAGFVYLNETEMLGVALSVNPVAKYERLANIKCLQFNNGKGSSNLTFAVVIVSVDERVIKSGPNINKRFANCKAADRSGEIEFTIFSKEWASMKQYIVQGSCVLLRGKRNEDGTLRVENVELL